MKTFVKMCIFANTQKFGGFILVDKNFRIPSEEILDGGDGMLAIAKRLVYYNIECGDWPIMYRQIAALENDGCIYIVYAVYFPDICSIKDGSEWLSINNIDTLGYFDQEIIRFTAIQRF